MTDAVLAFDAGPAAGMGHLRRMEALAGALSPMGVQVHLVPTDAPVEADLLVVDSYRCRADDRSRFRARVVAALDDLQRDLATDVVIDPSPGAVGERHQAARLVLAGPAYALVDRGLRTLTPRPIGEQVATVLVATGAADEAGHGAGIAEALAELLPDAEIRVAVGPWGAAPARNGVVVVRTDRGLGAELAASDLVVTAAGVTLLESLALGRPTVAVVLAENQRQAAEGAADVGAAVVASVADAAMTAAALAADADHRRRLAQGGVRLVDGWGAERVAEAVVAAA